MTWALRYLISSHSMTTITGRKYSYTRQQPYPSSLRPIQTSAKRCLVQNMFLSQAITIILSTPVTQGEKNKLWNIPDNRLAVRPHPSSKERTTWQHWSSITPNNTLLFRLNNIFSRRPEAHIDIVLATRSVKAQHKGAVRYLLRFRVHPRYKRTGENGKSSKVRWNGTCSPSFKHSTASLRRKRRLSMVKSLDIF